MTMLRFLLTMCLALGWAVPGQAQSNGLTALGKDYQALGWEAVGRLDVRVGYCTATLIAPDLVLSAAHCVYGQDNRLMAAETVRFRAGFRNGAVAAERAVAQIVAHPGFDPRAPLNYQNVTHDVALVRLARPIPTSEVDGFALHGDGVGRGAVSVVSYGKGRSEVQSRQRSCQLLERQTDLLMFDCNVTFGSSGAPVFSHQNGRGRILSVISGMVTLNSGQRVAVGPHLPRVVADLKTALRASTRGPVAEVRRLRVGQGGGAGGAKFVKVD